MRYVKRVTGWALSKRPGPWMQMTAALVGLSGTLVLLADMFFGVFHTPEHENAKLQQVLAQNMAVQLAVVLQQDDLKLLRQTVSALAEQNSTLSDLAVRRSDGVLLAHAAGPAAQAPQAPSTPASARAAGAALAPSAAGAAAAASQADALARFERAKDKTVVPLQTASGTWGQIEMRYTADPRGPLQRFFMQPLVLTMLFMGGAGTIVFALYLRRVLQHLDPSSAVPDRVQNAFDVMSEGVVVLDDRGRVLLVNKAFRKLHPQAETLNAGVALSGVTWLAQGLGEDEQLHPWAQTLTDRRSLAGISLLIAAGSGEERHLMVNCTPITDAGGATRGCMATFDDVSELHRSNSALRDVVQALNHSNEEVQRQNIELERLATRDPLTGCLNRRAFLAAFEKLVEQSRASGQPLSCLMLDIDHFKSVNDRFGHGIGDRVIQEVAKRMQVCARSTDLVGRYGGEEFCIVMPGLSQGGAAELGERLRQRIEAECGSSVREVQDLKVTASLGVEALGPKALTPALMMDRADQALYRAKRSGRNRVAVFYDEAPPAKASQADGQKVNS